MSKERKLVARHNKHVSPRGHVLKEGAHPDGCNCEQERAEKGMAFWDLISRFAQRVKNDRKK